MKKIDEENVLLEKKVVEIGGQKDIVFDDGKKLHANNIVLTGESRGLVNEPIGQYNSTKTLYLYHEFVQKKKNIFIFILAMILLIMSQFQLVFHLHILKMEIIFFLLRF